MEQRMGGVEVLEIQEAISAETAVYLRVALDVPLPGLFDYRSSREAAVGQRVIVPFGRRQLVGVVVAVTLTPAIAEAQCRDVLEILEDLPPFPQDWMRMMEFASRYYQRPLGEVMMPALPPPLRKASAYTGKRAGGGPVARLERRLEKQRKKHMASEPGRASSSAQPQLNDEQLHAVDTIAAV